MKGNRYSQSFWCEKTREKIRCRFDWNASGKLLVYCVVVGCLAGFCTAGLYSVLREIIAVVQGLYPAVGIELPHPENYTATTGPMPGETFHGAERKDVFGSIVLPRYWILILLIPSLGGLMSGFLVRSFAPDAFSNSTDLVLRAFHTRSGTLRNRIPITKLFASFLTLGTGGSAGFEGPIKLFGAWTAHCLAQGLQLNSQDRRTLLLAGAAGGLGALFQIPIGGAFFAVEVLYASSALEFSAILPCILASACGFAIFQNIHGDIMPIYVPETVGIHTPIDSLMLCLSVPIIALAGLLFVMMHRELRYRFFRRLPIADWFRPALGGFLLGVIALFLPQVFGGGYTWLPSLLHGTLPFALIAALVIPKMLATALTVSSGGSGGLFAPSLFIGGLIGGTLGHCLHWAFIYFGIQTAPPDIAMCVLVGMSVFFAGIAKLPFAAAIIVCELAGFHYELLVPLIALNLLHIAIQSPSISLYEEQVLTPIDSEAHFGHYSIDLLKVLTVRDALAVQCDELTEIPKSLPITEAVKLIASKPESTFAVLDSEKKFFGMVSANDLWGAFQHWSKWRGKSVGELTQTMPIVVSLEVNLYEALRTCLQEHVSELPVLAPEDSSVLLGVVRRSDILSAYNERLAEARWT